MLRTPYSAVPEMRKPRQQQLGGVLSAPPVHNGLEGKARPSKTSPAISRSQRTLTIDSIGSSRPFHYPEAKGALHCSKVSLESLARKYGTPLYIYSADQILERLALFQNAFAARDHLVCYAVKANSSLAILKLLADRGAGFDIVSGGELATRARCVS